ncbi:hypothetical protein T552_02775 [Pneumocystis carinii B80]|uniref:Ubiquitin-like domain-containing protein n=1 Tax=Pneumocystis carinii (strain B80) TaxID=1408658 RepID=A0A0W4ZEG5_PNEC8|nr:hypothetical protein T552_02775 [Pneumocystis carinii B80]KTW26774.1 hypothetical protein T552_02775 [Pneumocystis carinii B80]
MWILKAKQQKTTVFLTAKPNDTLKTLKQELQRALYDTSLLEKTDDKMADENSCIRLKIHGIIQMNEDKSLEEVGLEDGTFLEFSRLHNGVWEPFGFEPYSDSNES